LNVRRLQAATRRRRLLDQMGLRGHVDRLDPVDLVDRMGLVNGLNPLAADPLSAASSTKFCFACSVEMRA
jgi:hypothetical protein